MRTLPGFVVLISTGKAGQQQPISARQWHSGFLPSRFQGVEFRSKGDPVLYVNNPKGVSTDRQRDVVDTVQALNRLENNVADDPEIATRIAQYEMAFRMQTSVPELMDISEGAARSSRPLRHPGRRRLVRRQLSAGTAAGGAGRAFHSAVPPRLGPSRRDQA